MGEARALYAMPVLGRYGLTHGILAWARCRIWCEQNDVPMLAPFWLKLRIGPYLRKERDKRNYFLLFHGGSAISGVRRLAILSRARSVQVGPEWPPCPPPTKKAQLLRFVNALEANDKKSFWQILGHEAFLRRELLAMTRLRYHPPAPAQPFIAVHVRLGDFLPVDSGANLAQGVSNTRLPMDWYIDRIEALRAALNEVVPVTVFSDGTDEEIASVLNLPVVSRAPRQQSVTDLLQMGDAVAVVASGSGFSMWGAFLGSAPRISYPGQQRVAIYEDRTRDLESPIRGEIPASFLSHVQARMQDFSR